MLACGGGGGGEGRMVSPLRHWLAGIACLSRPVLWFALVSLLPSYSCENSSCVRLVALVAGELLDGVSLRFQAPAGSAVTGVAANDFTLFVLWQLSVGYNAAVDDLLSAVERQNQSLEWLKASKGGPRAFPQSGAGYIGRLVGVALRAWPFDVQRACMVTTGHACSYGSVLVV